MGLADEQTTARMGQLFEQVRTYFTLQKEYLSLHGVELLTRLFSAIALAAILILVGFLVVLFGSFALAYWIGSLLGSQVLGFGIIAAALLLCALFVWANRGVLIIKPTIHFMIGLLATHVVFPTIEGVQAEKARLDDQLKDNQSQMHDTASAILAPRPEARNRWESASNLFQNGMTIFHGVQIGLSIISAARHIFGIGRKRRR